MSLLTNFPPPIGIPSGKNQTSGFFFPEALPQAQLISGLQPDNHAMHKNHFNIHHFTSHRDPLG